MFKGLSLFVTLVAVVTLTACKGGTKSAAGSPPNNGGGGGTNNYVACAQDANGDCVIDRTIRGVSNLLAYEGILAVADSEAYLQMMKRTGLCKASTSTNKAVRGCLADAIWLSAALRSNQLPGSGRLSMVTMVNGMWLTKGGYQNKSASAYLMPENRGFILEHTIGALKRDKPKKDNKWWWKPWRSDDEDTYVFPEGREGEEPGIDTQEYEFAQGRKIQIFVTYANPEQTVADVEIRYIGRVVAQGRLDLASFGYY